MNALGTLKVVAVACLVGLLMAGTALAAGRGGGGRGGGGGGARGGGIRSSPSFSRPAARSSPSMSRAAPAQREYAPSYARSSTVRSSASERSSLATERPANAGSLLFSGGMTTRPGTYARPTQLSSRGLSDSVNTSAGVRNSGGYGTSSVRGPQGSLLAGVRGPNGNEVYSNLPEGASRYGNGPYWNSGYNWYNPYWQGDDFGYEWVYLPVGYYYQSLPPDYTTMNVGAATYYNSDGVYYQAVVQNGAPGYVVAAAPKAGDPYALLKTMTDYLGSLQNFSVVANTVADETITGDSGKLPVDGQWWLSVSRPDKFRAEVRDNRGDRLWDYDGKDLALFSQPKNLYGSGAAPATIDATMDLMAKNHGAALPVLELARTDLYPELTAHITSAQYVGLHQAGGVACYHLAFTQDNLDWEIWIQSSGQPLPRRMTITYKQLPQTPRFTSELDSWNVTPSFSPGTFHLDPPAGAVKVNLTEQLAPPRAAGP